ncbi:hypothetical protein VIGAN_01173400 [Vigna angularis var. angularis]|uniref:Uncharacterized protein n=1 Tax=Vigna angularis var. angularis TaxID=157739 RepID=A0A0S3R0K9_PHAAN|nr:hypothetical protein VIGAN_01173400 [Vigna angularis var. angularis]
MEAATFALQHAHTNKESIRRAGPSLQQQSREDGGEMVCLMNKKKWSSGKMSPHVNHTFCFGLCRQCVGILHTVLHMNE